MEDRTRIYGVVAFAMALFLGVQLGGLILVEPLEAADKAFTQNPDDPTNSILYVGAILVMTALMLAAFKYDLDWIVRGFVVVASAGLAWQVFDVLVPSPFGLALAALVGVALVAYPEWYVIDAAGVLMGGAAAGLFGISFGLLPTLVLLVVLAVYDAISVYGTEHMLDLADGVMDMKVPVILVLPTSLTYSFLDMQSPDNVDTGDEDEVAADGGNADASAEQDPANAEPAGDAEDDTALDRGAFFVGLGDAVMPTILVASAAHFHTAVPNGPLPDLGLPLVTMNLPALGAIVGTQLGLVVLLWMVFKGRAHAGLPLLNGGAIAGYLLCALAAGLPLTAALGL
ncbi:presenilin family intramembrane aspartyl protease PSH [Halorubellus sp. PRR65]|uniref:presenilin family intramembrane aspartyl protease PSH n=1 Tax=Halorubellus sp. PRR65 TaxID=3098148 RepID=UPI002B25B603|nr:presenilin family intramembrane aspartyl protease PSH [Halorubellus sp. PRR65]